MPEARSEGTRTSDSDSEGSGYASDAASPQAAVYPQAEQEEDAEESPVVLHLAPSPSAQPAAAGGTGAEEAYTEDDGESSIDHRDLEWNDIPEYGGPSSAYTPSESGASFSATARASASASASAARAAARGPAQELLALRAERELLLAEMREDLRRAKYKPSTQQSAPHLRPPPAIGPVRVSSRASNNRSYLQELDSRVDDSVAGAVRALAAGPRTPERSRLQHGSQLHASAPTLPRASVVSPYAQPQALPRSQPSSSSASSSPPPRPSRGISLERPVTTGAMRALDVTRSAALLPVEYGDALQNLRREDTRAEAAAADFEALERRSLALQEGRVAPRVITEVTAKRTRLAASKCEAMKAAAVERIRAANAVRQRLASERRATSEAQWDLRGRAPAVFHRTPYGRFAPPPVPAPKKVLELSRLSLDPHYEAPRAPVFKERTDWSRGHL
eukprot:tig00000194_g14789.t1